MKYQNGRGENMIVRTLVQMNVARSDWKDFNALSEILTDRLTCLSLAYEMDRRTAYGRLMFHEAIERTSAFERSSLIH